MKEDKCAYCDATEGLEWHHILPKSLGGTDESFNLVRLCGYHHGLIHGLERTNVSELTKVGMQKAKEKGVILGPPLKIPPNILTSMVEDRKRNSLQTIAFHYNYSISTVAGVISKWSDRLAEYTEMYNLQQAQYSKS